MVVRLVPEFTASHWHAESAAFVVEGRHFIDGALQPSRDGSLIALVNPATGKMIGEFSAGAEADVDAAVRAARSAFAAGACSHRESGWRFCTALPRWWSVTARGWR
jgi:hypothetical protein